MSGQSGGLSPPGFDDPMKGNESNLCFTESVSLLQCIESKINSEADLSILSQIDIPISLLPELQETISKGYYHPEKHLDVNSSSTDLSNAIPLSKKALNIANKILNDVKNKATQIVSSNFPNAYEIFDAPPFVVYLESLDKNLGQLRDMQIGKMLFSNKTEGIKKIGKRGKNKIGIDFSTLKHANTFLSSDFATNNNMKSYIPNNLISCKGILRQVDPSLDVGTILDNLRTSDERKVLGVRRIQRKTEEEGKTVFVNTASVIVTFRGKNLPQFTSLFYNIRVPELYILPVTQCKNCCRYGHTGNQCRSKNRCPACAYEHTLKDCPSKSSPTCVFCKGAHFTTEDGTRFKDRCCPEFLYQRDIKISMATYGYSYFEASSICRRKFSFNSNQQTSHVQFNHKDFPSLRNSDSSLLEVNLNTPLSANKSFSQVSQRDKHHYFTKVLNVNKAAPAKRKNPYNEEFLINKNGRMRNWDNLRATPTDPSQNEAIMDASQIEDNDFHILPENCSVSDLSNNSVVMSSLKNAYEYDKASLINFFKKILPSSVHNNLSWLSSQQEVQAQIH